MKLTTDSNAPRTFVFIGALTIIIACFTAYIPAIKGGFIWDDDLYVTENPLLTAPNGLYLIWFSFNPPAPQYVPLVYTTIDTTFWIEHKLWGFNPMGYHAVNVAIHIINALLLWTIFRRLSFPGAWFASAVFALHPVQVESAAWITELKNTMMLFFSLLSVLCWIEFALGNRPTRKAFYKGSILFFVLAFFSKSTACTLPAVLVLILWLKRSPLTLKRWLQVAPFVIIGIAAGLLVMWREQRLGTGIFNFGIGPAGKLLIAGRALWFYLWKLFWPVNLAFSYPRWHIDPTVIWQYIWPAVSITALVCSWLWRERLGRGVVTAILFFAATLFPMLGFFSLYTFIYSFVADHYQYAACIGPIALVAAGGALVYRRSGKNLKFIILSAAGILILTLWILSWRQCHAYANVETLWLDTLKKNPDAYIAHGKLFKLYYKQGKINKAEFHLEKAIEKASYIKTITPCKYALFFLVMGSVLQNSGRPDEAIIYYQKALDIWEHFVLAHYQLGLVLAQNGDIEGARYHFLRALEITKDEKEVRLNRETCTKLNVEQLNEEIFRRLNRLEEEK
jgi:tetratricopeptide (TPR) repeat protein